MLIVGGCTSEEASVEAPQAATVESPPAQPEPPAAPQPSDALPWADVVVADADATVPGPLEDFLPDLADISTVRSGWETVGEVTSGVPDAADPGLCYTGVDFAVADELLVKASSPEFFLAGLGVGGEYLVNLAASAYRYADPRVAAFERSRIPTQEDVACLLEELAAATGLSLEDYEGGAFDASEDDARLGVGLSAGMVLSDGETRLYMELATVCTSVADVFACVRSYVLSPTPEGPGVVVDELVAPALAMHDRMVSALEGS